MLSAFRYKPTENAFCVGTTMAETTIAWTNIFCQTGNAQKLPSKKELYFDFSPCVPARRGLGILKTKQFAFLRELRDLCVRTVFLE